MNQISAVFTYGHALARIESTGAKRLRLKLWSHGSRVEADAKFTADEFRALLAPHPPTSLFFYITPNGLFVPLDYDHDAEHEELIIQLLRQPAVMATGPQLGTSPAKTI